ncbi:capsular associated protein [Lentinula guzmanii]|uniref:Capsular associated protein n=1 Tax=Lentinula guzmanii TaxID=2804957 RepID=A0AA38K0K8_9AGAR|nr:capsular associated protein [Lentinula guzmanii]
MSTRPMLTRAPSDSPWTLSNQPRFSQRKWRPLLMLTLLACSTVAIFKVGLPARSSLTSHISSAEASSAHPSTLTYSTHPITRMMKEAEERFQAKIERQSKTLPQAIEEYKRRYGMSPPKGFDAWWEFAQKNEVVLVDEYDTLMRDLAPFYALRGQKEFGDYTDDDEDPSRPGSGLDRHGWALGGGFEMRRRIAEVASVASIDMVQIRKGNLSTVSISKDGFVDDEVSARAKGLKAMLGSSAANLPDFDFPVNAKAEGRVIVPWDRWTVAGQGGMTGEKIGLGMGNRSYMEDTAPHDTKDTLHPLASFHPDWRGAGNVWDKWRRTCPPTSPARKSYASIRSALIDGATTSHNVASEGITDSSVPAQFAFSASTSFDSVSFCDQPHLHYTQGHFFSDWRTLDDLYPVLSPARAKGFGDIKIPSHYYYGSTQAYTYGWDKETQTVQAVDRGEVAWGDLTDAGSDGEGGVDDRNLIIDPSFDGHNNTANPPRNRKTGKESKRNKIFWRGATTGGGNSPAGFAALYQRHRAVRTADWAAEGDVEIWVPSTNPIANISSTPVAPGTQHSPIAVTDAPLKAHKISVATLNKAMMDVAFVKASNANQYPGGLKKLQEEHRFADGVALGDHWQYKYLLDLDGMSYSGRFMSFLASDSVPIKSTVYEEFFSEWIEPWLHYVPLSSSYEELYNIFGYFSGIPAEVVEEVYGDAVDPATGAPLFPPGTKIPAIPGAPDGDARLRHIAQAGKDWKNTIARKVDMEAYVYRLALEWARLNADDREVMTMQV